MDERKKRILAAAAVLAASFVLAAVLVWMDRAEHGRDETLPTATPTAEETPTSTPEPTQEATPAPTAGPSPTPEPTPEPSPEPTPDDLDPSQMEHQGDDRPPQTTQTPATGSNRNKTYSEARYNTVVKQVLDKIITDGMTPREQCYAVYKYVKYHITYTGSSDKSDWKKGAYSGFVNGTGDCYSYYACCRALLTELGIDNMEVQRYGSTMPSRHYWNLVNYGEGWYHMDACPHLLVDPAFECFMATDQELINFSAGAGRQYYYFNFDSPDYPERVGGGVDWDNIQPMPDRRPTTTHTPTPTASPTPEPTSEPTVEPTVEPTAEPTAEPTVEPTVEPTAEPTTEPTGEPTAEPTAEPTTEPTVEPTAEPTTEPTTEPTVEPTAEPTAEPTVEPTVEPAPEPTPEPTPGPAPVDTPAPEGGESEGL